MDVPGMVPEELLLEVLHDQFHLVLEVGGRCRDGGCARCARRKVGGEGEEEARASPSRRSANENFKTVTYATEGFSGRSKAETSASWTN